MIKQSIACENMKMHCWMFKEGMYEYMMSLPWEFVRMMHRIGNHVVRRMWSFTHLDGWTSMAKIEWGIRVAQPRLTGKSFIRIHKVLDVEVRIATRWVINLKWQFWRSKTRIANERRSKSMITVSSSEQVKRDWKHLCNIPLDDY